MWEERESKKPAKERKPVPISPIDVPLSCSMKNINDHNTLVSEAFTNNVMVRCPNCFRTFLEDRIEVHLRSCTIETPHKIAPSIAATEESAKSQIKTYTPNGLSSTAKPKSLYDKTFTRPKAVLCHIW